MSDVSNWTKKHAQPSLLKIIENHEKDCIWYMNLGIPYERISYEWIYRNELERYERIRDSLDLWTRLRPDFKSLFFGRIYRLVDVKSSDHWLPALGLSYNAIRNPPVIYILARQYVLSASDVFENQSKYLEKLRIYKRKMEPVRRVNHLKKIFSSIPFEEVDYPIGNVWYNGMYKYVSGDSCVALKDCARRITLAEILSSWNKMDKMR